MTRFTLLSGMAVLALSVPGLAWQAQWSAGAGGNASAGTRHRIQPDLTVYKIEIGASSMLVAQVKDGFGPFFSLYACPVVGGSADLSNEVLLGSVALNGGHGRLVVPAPDVSFQPVGGAFAYRARFIAGPNANGVLGNPPSETVDWDFLPGIGPATLPAGTPVSGQWSAIGLTIGAQNNVPGHPNDVIIFDSANPTGGDGDLATPGYGPGNGAPLGSLLIIPENGVDANGDGIYDDPDDEGEGGTMHFDFATPVRVHGITLVDVDDPNPTSLEFYNGVILVESISVANAGDNSVQRLLFDVFPVTRLEVVLGGSGGIADLDLSLCPTKLDFDRFTTGMPIEPAFAGQVTTSFPTLGIAVSAQNNRVAGPDLAILFDTSNPTGGDTDLVTPGYGVGNSDESVPTSKMALIVAENDVDANFDGFIDVPDDEEAGGVITMEFIENVTFLSASVLDIDENEVSHFELYDEVGVLVATLPLAPLGDNSMQNVGEPSGIANVRRIELHLSGSGAWVDLVYCPQILDL